MVRLNYYPDDDVLTVYLEDVGEDHFEDRGNVTILYRDGRPIGFEVWQTSKLLAAVKSLPRGAKRAGRRR